MGLKTVVGWGGVEDSWGLGWGGRQLWVGVGLKTGVVVEDSWGLGWG